MGMESSSGKGGEAEEKGERTTGYHLQTCSLTTAELPRQKKISRLESSQTDSKTIKSYQSICQIIVSVCFLSPPSRSVGVQLI